MNNIEDISEKIESKNFMTANYYFPGEDECLLDAESDGNIVCAEDDDYPSIKIPEDKLAANMREKLVTKFKIILTERQELRRKNLFLQKKMVEFFKKRKMDHALKEDPKGLDLESKYLKRLYELQQYKRFVQSGGTEMEENIETLREETKKLNSNLANTRQEFLTRQKNVAVSLELKKTEKKISKQAITSFLTVQSANMVALTASRLKEIKMKRILSNRRDLVEDMENLGEGISRGYYEQQKFKKQAACKQFEDKLEESSLLQEKVRRVVECLTTSKQKECRTQRDLDSLQKNVVEVESQVLELRDRLHKLGKRRDELRIDAENLLTQSGLLTRDNLLLDFEASLQDATNLWQKLEKEEVSYRARVARKRGGQVNTPTNYFAVEENFDDRDDNEKHWSEVNDVEEEDDDIIFND